MQAALFQVILFRIPRQNKQALWISQSLRQSKQGNPPANPYQRSVIVLILPDLNQSKSKRCPIPQRGAVKSLYESGHGQRLCGRQIARTDWIRLSPPHRSLMVVALFARLLAWLTMALSLSWMVSRHNLWNGVAKNSCGSGCEITLCDRRRSSAQWIGLSLSLHGSHTAADFFARPLTWLTVVLHPNQTVCRPNPRSVAVRTMCGRDRRKPQRSAGKVIMGRNVLRPLGSGMQATPSPRASPHCPLKMGNSQRKALRGELFPTAINESKGFP